MLLLAQYVFPISDPIITDGAVLVRDGRISDIGPIEKLSMLYPEEETVSFGKAVIMPGLVNLNGNMENVVLRGIVEDVPFVSWLRRIALLNHKLEPGDLLDSAMVGCMDAITSGITCVADITSTGDVLEAYKAMGLRGVIYRRVSALEKKRLDYAMDQATGDVERWNEELKADGHDSRIDIGIAPATVFTTHPEVYRRVSAYACKTNTRMALRLASCLDEYNFIKYGSSPLAVESMEEERGYVEIPPWLPSGVSPVEYAYHWGAFDAPNVMVVDAVTVDNDDIKILRENNVGICHSPRANAQLGKGVAPLNEFLKAHMKVGLGTDSPAATNSIDILTEMRMALLIARATNPRTFIDASEMLELATLGGARVLGLDDKIGSLEIGKCADIIAVDLSGSHKAVSSNPVMELINTCTSDDVMFTMIDGQVLYQRKKWKVDESMTNHIARVLKVRNSLRS